MVEKDISAPLFYMTDEKAFLGSKENCFSLTRQFYKPIKKIINLAGLKTIYI